MREIMRTSDISCMSMANEIQMSVSRVPATLPQLGAWLEDCIRKLDLGMILGAMLESRKDLIVVKDTMERVASRG
eukprot:12171801-Prorocentrum_lima.AAC.1